MKQRLLLITACALVVTLAAVAWWTMRGAGPAAPLTTDTAAVAPAASAEVELAASHADAAATETASGRVPSVDGKGPAGPAAVQPSGEVQGSARSSLAVRAVDGGVVRLFLRPPDPAVVPGAERMRSVAIASDGSFRMERVLPGEWEALVIANGFEPHQGRLLVEAGAVTRLDVTVVPSWASALVISLRRPNGLPLIGSLEGFELEIAGALRPVLLEECPLVGASLPAAARKLTHKAEDARRDDPGQWMKTWFKVPTAGCACVALGDRVLDAVPFVAGQEFVALTVDPSALSAQLCACAFEVRADDPARTPLPGAWAKFAQQDGGTLVLHPDASGRVYAEHLLAGEVQITVTLAGYADVVRRITLVPGTTNEIETILLARSASIRGAVSFQSAEPRTVSVSLVRVLPEKTELVQSRTASNRRVDFEFLGLSAGDYMVGFQSTPSFPDPALVKSNAAAGWSWVQVTPGADATTGLVLTEALWSAVRAVLIAPPGPR